MNFKDFKKDVESAFNAMIADNLFVVNVDKDLLWMSYLLSFEAQVIAEMLELELVSLNALFPSLN